LLAVGRETPALARISDRVDERERRCIVDIRDSGFSRELIETSADEGQALTKTIGRKRVSRENAARGEIDPSHLGTAVLTRALEENAVRPKQPLRVRGGIVGISRRNLERLGRATLAAACDDGEREKNG